MSQNDACNMEASDSDFWAKLPFTRILGGFQAAAQPGKLLLGLLAVVAVFATGWVMDAVTPPSMRAVVDATGTVNTELTAYVSRDSLASADAFAEYRDRIRANNAEALRMVLTEAPINRDPISAEDDVRAGRALGRIKDEYDDSFDSAAERLESYYERRFAAIVTKYQDGDAADAAERCSEELAGLKSAYEDVFSAMVGETVDDSRCRYAITTIVTLAPSAGDEESRDRVAKARKRIGDTVTLARAYRLAQAAQGRGVFATFIDFKMQCFHGASLALIKDHNVAVAGTYIYACLKGVCWMARFHPVYSVVFMLVCFCVWAIVGGAICRISALQTARDERIGPMRALKFSLGKFGSFFTAPLIPIAIIILIALVMSLVSLLGAIPYVGEILVGVFMGLALFGGFVIALISVGLIGGFNLMYPTIAVEGSDGFDAISRSFSYVFARPWRMLFYTALAAVYGAVCYLFVRFFAWILLLAVHSSVGLAVNWDSAGLATFRGKLDAMWATPTFSNLHASINWLGLNWSEAVGAALIWLWVALIVALVMSFVFSFFFSVNTTIYFLLRRRVDATDIEDVFVDEDVDELVTSETPASSDAQPQDQSAPAEPSNDAAESTSAEQSEPSDDSSDTKQPDSGD